MSGEQTFFSLTRLPWPVRQPAGWAALLWTLGTGMAYAQGSLPAESDLRGTRRLVMWAAHLMVVVPLLAVFLARGVGTR